MKPKSLLIIILSFIICLSCQKEIDTSNKNNWEVLEDTTGLANVTAGMIRLVAQFQDITQFNEYFQKNISVYKITYHTTYHDSDIIVSGLISFPENITEPAPVLIVQNGLFYESSRAPSRFSLPDNYIGYEFIASYGYIVFLPDLIGFGDSEDLIHPLYNYQYSASVVIDMIKAGREFIECMDIPSEDKYYLCGYSLGSYVSTAAQKGIEEVGSIDIDIMGNAVGAGGFNIYGVMKSLLENDSYDSPADISMVFMAYNESNQWDRPLSDFFKEGYAAVIPKLFTGDFSREEINILLPVEIDSLLNPDILIDLSSGTESQMTVAFTENSVHDWKPIAPIRIYHGKNDERIPYEDSWEAYQTMKANGAGNVKFFEIEGTDHFNAVFDFMGLVLPWFDSLRYDL